MSRQLASTASTLRRVANAADGTPVRKRPFAIRAVNKVLRTFDPLLSRLELSASDLELRASTSHQQRLVLLNAATALRAHGTVVYDIGAATGDYATAFAKVSTVSEVVAFEPLSDSFAELARRSRKTTNIRCFHLALGDAKGRLDLRRSAWRDSSSFLPFEQTAREEFPLAAQIEGAEPVNVERLDDVVAEHGLPLPNLVKLDVQGFEDRVIRGGRDTLRSVDSCIIEVSFRPLYEGSALFDDVYSLMRELGFHVAGVQGLLSSSKGEALQADVVFEQADASAHDRRRETAAGSTGTTDGRERADPS